MTLAQQLVNQERTRTQLVDEGFNRHTDVVGGDGLPSWFIDDEQRHFRHNIPITKDAVQAIRDKQRELNARPIKKVAEAKARKKMRTIRRLEKMKAKAQGINDDEENGLTEKEKAASIAKVLARSAKAGKTKKPETKLVVARGPNRGISGRPKGVKGKYKVRTLSHIATGRLCRFAHSLPFLSSDCRFAHEEGGPRAQAHPEARPQILRPSEVISSPLDSVTALFRSLSLSWFLISGFSVCLVSTFCNNLSILPGLWYARREINPRANRPPAPTPTKHR